MRFALPVFSAHQRRCGQTILDGAGAQALAQPQRHQGVDVLLLEAGHPHVLEAQGVELFGTQVEAALAIGLGGEAAVAVAQTQLPQFVVQLAHTFPLALLARPALGAGLERCGFQQGLDLGGQGGQRPAVSLRVRRPSPAPFIPALFGCCAVSDRSGKCFWPSALPRQGGTIDGHGDTTPVVCGGFASRRRHTASWLALRSWRNCQARGPLTQGPRSAPRARSRSVSGISRRQAVGPLAALEEAGFQTPPPRGSRPRHVLPSRRTVTRRAPRGARLPRQHWT